MNRLDGKRWEFFGVNENCLQVRELGTEAKRVFEAIEDESDGYRSCLGDFKELGAGEQLSRKLFFNETPFAVVTSRCPDRLSEVPDRLFDGIQLVDDSGHVWLTVGTDNTENYYPCFEFSYSPKAMTP